MKVTCLGNGAARTNSRHEYNCWIVDERLLIDVAPQVVPAFNRHGCRSADFTAVLLTHFDADHILGFPLFLPSRPAGMPPLPVIGPVGTRTILSELCRLGRAGHKLDRARFIELAPGEKTKLDGYELETVPMLHEEESIGFLLTDAHGLRLGISGDTDWCAGLEYLLREADALIIEMTFIDAPRGRHLSLRRDAERLLDCARPGAILLASHLGKEDESYHEALRSLRTSLPVGQADRLSAIRIPAEGQSFELGVIE